MTLFTQFVAAGPGPGGSNFLSLILPFGLMFAIMYVLIIRPQRKKEKDRKALLARVRKNDRVITSGGIHGKVATVRENELIITIDEAKDVKIKIDRNAVASVSLSESEEEGS